MKSSCCRSRWQQLVVLLILQDCCCPVSYTHLLELGGKAPGIVMPDADLDLAVKSIIASRVINTGQVLSLIHIFPARAGAITRHDKEFNDYLVPPELARATEVASFNYQSDKYDAYLKYRPDLILFQSEAEMCIRDR